MSIAKRIVILEQLGASPLSYRYLMWADVPASRQIFYAAMQSGMVSAWKGASAADNAALQNGSVTERVDSTPMLPGDNLAAAMARLQAIWTAFQAEIAVKNDWGRYGSFMDTSNAWTNGGVS
ncbi:MAG TPA: hypothetical protein VJP60_06895 [Rhizomicrobium sp.]|nr:hypothetical protein [Rhizomicrobium sp.]